MTSADRFLLRLVLDHDLVTGDARSRAVRYLGAPSGESDGRGTGTWLVEEAGVDEDEVARFLGGHFGLPVELDLLAGRSPDNLKTLAPRSLALQHSIVPLERRSDGLVVAIDNPLDESRLLALGESLGCALWPVISTGKAIAAALDQIYPSGPATASSSAGEGDRLQMDGNGGASSSPTIDGAGPITPINSVGEVSIAEAVGIIITDAIRRAASDIHLEPMERRFRVRQRLDGELKEVATLPMDLHLPIISRLKLLSSLSISERRLPQDGRMRYETSDCLRDIRVSTLPTVWGESMVMRILDPSRLLKPTSELGLSAYDQGRWNEVVGSADGMILVTGPTGSGKTTTLYSTLQRLNDPSRKIVTVEDPVEFEVAGINQVGVRPDLDVTFSRALRSILRQSPDVIMVGEVRDRETAEIAVHAALTGHLLFSTLHTNDAVGAVSRLIDLGVKPYLVASSLRAVLAQRLIRRTCTACRGGRRDVDEESRCPLCHGTGFSGRIGIFELLVPDTRMREAIGRGASAEELRTWALRAGMSTLRDDGLAKVDRQETTLAEVLGATMNESE